MHNVTDEQIDFILKDIAKKGIRTEDVKYNILDHVCCIIEREMPKGADFYEFYKNTIARFYKKELSEIEEETRDLVTFKYYHAMKRTMKITGLLSVLLITIGAIFKMQHLPGAGISLVLGFAIFSLVFLPLNIVLKYRDDKEKYNRIVMTLGLSTTLIGTIGLLFKVMHWPYANIIFFGSLGVFALIFIPSYFFTRYRNPETKFNAIMHTTFMIAGTGMIIAMIDLGPSHFITDSVESMDSYQVENVNRIKKSNEELYTAINGNIDEVEKMRMITAKINQLIEGIKQNLISKSNGTNVSGALSLENAINPNDIDVIKHHFELASDETSYQHFQEAVNNYNNEISNLNNSEILRPIEIEDLQMTKTILSVVLHQLADIQVQVLSNENSYLCLQKGLLAAK